MSLLSLFLRNNSLFNVSHENVSMFIIEKGEKIEKGDSVVVDTSTLLAKKPVEEGGYFHVGVAARILKLADGNQAVVCVDGFRMFYNPDGSISETDIGKACYFADSDTVTMDNINKTKAGIIVGFELSDDPINIEDGADRIVVVKTNIVKESDLEW